MNENQSQPEAQQVQSGEGQVPEKPKSKRGGKREGAGRKPKAVANNDASRNGPRNSKAKQAVIRHEFEQARNQTDQSVYSNSATGEEIKSGIIDQASPNQFNSNENGAGTHSTLAVPEGQRVREVNADSHGQEAKPKTRREPRGQRQLGPNDPQLLEAVAQCIGQSGNPQNVHDASGNGEADRHSGEGAHVVHAEASAGCADQHSEQQQSEHADAKQPDAGGEAGAGEREQITAEEQRQLFDPAIYCSLYCREPGSWRYSAKQIDFMRACRVVREDLTLNLADFPRNLALGAVNGVGKTQIIGDLIRYFMDTIPNCGVGFTSHVDRQCEALYRYLIPHQMQPRYGDWKCVVGKMEAPNGNWARWFTAKDVGAVESLHAPFMIRILDEVKSMKDEIIDATNRWQPKLTIFISSKGLMSGRFYDCFTRLREFWQIHEINAADCPWIPQRWIEEQLVTHGPSSALVKSMITNEFSDVDLRVLITIEAVNDILRHEPQWEDDGQIVAALDVSAAKRDGDECVMIHRRGNKVMDPWSCPPSDNEMEVVGRVMNRIREVKPHHLFVDIGGSGSPVASRIAEVVKSEDGRTAVHRVDFGGKANDGRKYARKNAEMYGVLSSKIVERKIILPNHPKLIGQVTSRQYTTNSQGQTVLESKETMRRRGAKSPDYADALVMCAMEPSAAWSAVRKTSQWYDDSHAKDIMSRNNNGVGMVGGKYLGRG